MPLSPGLGEAAPPVALRPGLFHPLEAVPLQFTRSLPAPEISSKLARRKKK